MIFLKSGHPCRKWYLNSQRTMDSSDYLLRARIETLLETWQNTGVPARATLHETADALIKWRCTKQIAGLWEIPPRMLGVTLDDGWGHGIQLILKYAGAVGVETQFLGLLKTWEWIVEACHSYRPDLLGLSVLQFDTEDALVALRRHLPADLKIVAGGPVFQIDPEFQARTGIDFVAKDAAGFLRILLQLDC